MVPDRQGEQEGGRKVVSDEREYRVVLHAHDGDGNLALQHSVGMRVGYVYLPLVLR